MDFRELLKSDADVTSYLSTDELSGLFDYSYYLRYVEETFRRIGLLEYNLTTGQISVE